MTNLAIALMLSLQVVSRGDVKQDRLRVVSEDIVSVVEQEVSGNSLKSGMKIEDAIPLLAAVALGESNLRRDIETCKVTGDGGRSVGLGQVMRGPNWQGHTRTQICSNRKLQLKLALHVLDVCRLRSKDSPSVLKCYTSGDPSKNSFAARHEYALYNRLRKSYLGVLDRQIVKTCSIENAYSLQVKEEKYTCEM